MSSVRKCICLVLFVFRLQLVLKVGNYMNKGNMRIGSAAAFKIEYLNKVS